MAGWQYHPVPKWYVKIGCLIDDGRFHTLEKIDDSRTKYATWEDFNGCFALLVPVKDVQRGFERQTAAMVNLLRKDT